MIHQTAIVEPNVELGEGTNVWAFVQIRKGAKIGKNCTIGNGSFIDLGVNIGNNVQIINKVLIHRGVEIEDDVFLGPAVCFINNKNPRSYSERNLKGVVWKVMQGASVGAGALVMADVNIGKYALVGAGSLVTKNVPNHGLVYGSPAKLAGFVCFCGKKLPMGSRIEEDGKVKLVCPDCQKEVLVKIEDFKLLN